SFRISGKWRQPVFGRRLPELLRCAGLEEVQCKVHVDIVKLRGARRKHLLTLLDSLHEKVISPGLLTNHELDAHKASVAKHLDDPDTVVIDKLLVQAWGRKASKQARYRLGG